MSSAVKPSPYESKPIEANNPLGTVAFVLGIIAFFAGCPISIAAMITGWMGMKKEPSGQAKIGFWLGAVALIVQFFATLIVLLVFGAGLGIGWTTVKIKPAPQSQLAPPVEAELEVRPRLEEAAPAATPPAPSDTAELPEEVAPLAP